jgi:hypothetical protein
MGDNVTTTPTSQRGPGEGGAEHGGRPASTSPSPAQQTTGPRLRSVPGERAVRDAPTYSAGLICGSVLTYEAPTFVPDEGEVVPCRRHGYCSVAWRDRVDGRGVRGPGRRMRRRSQTELLDFLSQRPVTNVHALRRNQFTLRTVTAAQHKGLVDVDLVTGRIALRRAVAG